MKALQRDLLMDSKPMGTEPGVKGSADWDQERLVLTPRPRGEGWGNCSKPSGSEGCGRGAARVELQVGSVGDCVSLKFLCQT